VKRFPVFLALALSGGALSAAPITLNDQGRPMLVYHTEHVPSPKADEPWYGRSGFIHPVYTPAGRVVTSGFPADHPHQHGVMFAWTSAEVDGHRVDFWNSRKQQGHIEHAELLSSSPDRIHVRLRHVDDTARPPVTVIHETWTLTRVPHPSMHVFDLVSTQTCATAQPVRQLKYHYGGLCVRGPEAWLERRADMETSEGRTRADGNHTRPDWVVLSGPMDGAHCGLVAMGHPSNFRAPQPVRLHPDKPYFCFAPMVTGDFALRPDQPYVSRFRFAAFDGKPDREALTALWRDFSDDGR
jgi:hypothetical protein